MKVFIVGGTTPAGSEAARELIRRGHDVFSLSPPLPAGLAPPPEMKIECGSYTELPEDELRAVFSGCDALVFAEGLNENAEAPAPVFAAYRRANVDPVKRLLRIARQCGMRRAVVLGSYLAYFAKTHAEWDLARSHPYVASCLDQENAALAYADRGFDVTVLELPYLFGTPVETAPAWGGMVRMLLRRQRVAFVPKGGTAMLTVRQAGEAVAGALERAHGAACYPLGFYNMTWQELLRVFHQYTGLADARIFTLPDRLYIRWAQTQRHTHAENGAETESGLNTARFAAVRCADLFLDPAQGCEPLGVQPDDIDKAIGDSAAALAPG